jgi:predicted Mrr-cat superfamily restriction endonuclease
VAAILPQFTDLGGRARWPASHYLRASCRAALEELTDEREYAAAFDRYEFLRGMLETAYGSRAALGEFVSRTGARNLPAIDEITDRWPLIVAGAFDGDPDSARDVYAKLSVEISQRQFFLWRQSACPRGSRPRPCHSPSAGAAGPGVVTGCSLMPECSRLVSQLVRIIRRGHLWRGAEIVGCVLSHCSLCGLTGVGAVTVWVVRAGRDLEFLSCFVSDDVVGIGWSELPRSPAGISRQELADMLRATYPDAPPNTIANNTGQIWHFVNTIALADLVVVPLKASRSFRVGRVVGPAEHRDNLAGLAAVRPVEWEPGEVPSQALSADLRNALGSIMTVFRPRTRAAERRLESVIKDGHDPGPDSGGDDRSGAWVFQANPKRFDLLQALRDGGTETWAVNQRRRDIQPGDRVWFRLTGPSAGVYAVGQVTSLPRPEASEFGDWRVDVTFESRIDPPLLRAESDADPVLLATSALAGLMGTNLSLSTEADTRLEELTENRLIPIAGREPPARSLERKLNLDAARIAERVERDLLEHLRGLSPARFEELCALYLRVLGCENVKVVGAATAGSLGDGGMDVTGTLARAGLPAVRLAVQAKRIAGGVGPNVVTQLRGSIPPGTYGIVITTGHFTRAAITEADRAGRNPIKLVDGPELAHVLVESGIGVKGTTIVIPRLDIEALEERLEAERG